MFRILLWAILLIGIITALPLFFGFLAVILASVGIIIFIIYLLGMLVSHYGSKEET